MRVSTFRAQVLSMPWIQHLDASGRCLAHVTGTRGPCRSPARWNFTPAERSTARAGHYCWRHLPWVLWDNWDEMDRTNDFIEAYERDARDPNGSRRSIAEK